MAKHNYVFPNILANAMSKVNQRTQYEASMMSMALMTIGLILSIVYISIYLEIVLWYKIVLLFNLVCGLLFMSSYLVTSFQQYQSYMEAYDFQNEMKGGNE